MNNLGKAVLSERKKRGLTQKQLASQIGITHSYISQVERGLIMPSLSVLRELSTVLNIPVSKLFDSMSDSEKRIGRTPIQIVRKEDRVTLIYPGSSVKNELLLPEYNPNFSITWLTFPAHSKNKPVGNYMLRGHMQGVVVSGELVFVFCSEPYTLKKGDAFNFDVSMDHNFINEKEEIAELILYTLPDL